MRLFIAAELPEGWRHAAARLGEQLLRDHARALRPVHPDAMHLTLRFIGELDAAHLPALDVAIAEEAPPVGARLTLGRAGTFGSPARTTTIWAGIDGEVEPLAALADRVERAVRSVGLPPEERAFRPHLTVARVHRNASPAERRAIADAVGALPSPVEPPFDLREIALVQSHLGGSRPRYEILSRYR